MPYEFQLLRRVEFSETDMAGIMHFSNFFRFMEAAEHAFFRSLGFSVVLSRAGFEVHLPRVHAECDYLAPVHFEDELTVHLLVQKKSSRSLTYLFRFYRMTDARQEEVARGRLVVVSTEVTGNGAMRAVSLPKAIADVIQEAPADLLGDASKESNPTMPKRSSSKEPLDRHRNFERGLALQSEVKPPGSKM